MGISIEAIRGKSRRGLAGELIDDVDAGVDAIYVTGRGPVAKRVGIVGREPGSAICLLEPGLSESLVNEIKQAVQKHHGGESSSEVRTAPAIEKAKK